MKSKWFLAFPVIILLVFVVICISTVVEKPEKQKSVKKQKTASEDPNWIPTTKDMKPIEDEKLLKLIFT